MLFYLKPVPMRFCLLIFLFLFGFYGSSQDSSWLQTKMSVDLFYGQKVLLKPTLNQSVGDINLATFGQPMTYLGVAFSGVLSVNRKFHYPAEVTLAHLVPQGIKFNDSISGRISGFNIGSPLAGYDIFRNSRNVDLLMAAGFNTGRVRLFGDARLEQVNAYFSPYVALSPRLVIGKIAMRIKVMFDVDLTRSRWRNVWFSRSPKVDLGPMKNSGFSSSISVGWIIV